MYIAKDYSNLLGISGFSNQLLENHFALYKAYVDNTNKLIDLIKQEENSPKKNELRRRLGWEWCGMRMHEYYFENMTKESNTPSQIILDLFDKHFGGYDNWKKDFLEVGAMRGVGWVVLYKDGDKLINEWIAEHEGGHFVGAKPILVMDCWEHAFILDYGIKRVDYLNTFMNVIDWRVVEKRLTE